MHDYLKTNRKPNKKTQIEPVVENPKLKTATLLGQKPGEKNGGVLAQRLHL